MAITTRTFYLMTNFITPLELTAIKKKNKIYDALVYVINTPKLIKTTLAHPIRQV